MSPGKASKMVSTGARESEPASGSLGSAPICQAVHDDEGPKDFRCGCLVEICQMHGDHLRVLAIAVHLLRPFGPKK